MTYYSPNILGNTIIGFKTTHPLAVRSLVRGRQQDGQPMCCSMNPRGCRGKMGAMGSFKTDVSGKKSG